MGRLFMDPLDDPFVAAETGAAEPAASAPRLDCIVADIHAEATSEKMAIGHILDGRVSLVVGTHSHVPTADARILAGGTAYMTDVGMCGDYDSVIGMRKEAADLPLRRQDADRPAGAGRRAGDALRRLRGDRRLRPARRCRSGLFAVGGQRSLGAVAAGVLDRSSSARGPV